MPLDTLTADRVFCQLGSVLARRNKYRIVGNPVFDVARAAKVKYMMSTKKEYQLGGLTSQAEALTVAELNMLLHSDAINIYTPFGLLALFYIQFCL